MDVDYFYYTAGFECKQNGCQYEYVEEVGDGRRETGNRVIK